MSNPSANLTVQTVSADGTAPTHRIGSAQALWSAYQEQLALGRLQDLRFTNIEGILAGFPPVPPQDLEAQGLVDAPNINLKQFRAKVSTYVSTWTDLNTGGDQWYDVKLKTKYFQSPQQWNDANQSASQFFNDAIKEWDAEGLCNASQYIYESMIRDTQMGVYGIGASYFPDPIDWRWKAIPTRRILVPEGTKVTLSDCPAMFIEIPMTVTELYEYSKKEGKDIPWNKEPILKALYNKTAQKHGANGMLESFSEWTNRIINNESCLQNNFSQVWTVHGYVQEFSTFREPDGITHYIILKDGIADNDYLYENNREYKSFNQLMVTFCDRTGPEGDWHGVKGFGDDIYDGCHFNNLMFNAIALGAQMTCMPMFQADNESDRQKLNQVVFSRLGILYPDLKISQFKMQVDLTGSLAMLSESNRVLDQNTRRFRQNQEGERQGRGVTATEVLANRQDEAQLQSGQIKLYRITGADRLGYTMYYRLSRPGSKYPEAWPGGKAAKEFRDKCKDAGIPEEAFGDPQSVKASRTGGSGSMAIDAQKADAVMMVATPGAGQTAARKEKAAALYGRERVAEFIQEEPVQTSEDVIVGLENGLIQDGKIVKAYPFQPVEVHLGKPTIEGNGHLGVAMAAQQAATMFQEDENLMMQNLDDAKQLNKVIEASAAHIGMHAKFMAEVPLYQKEVQALGTFLKRLQTFHAGYGEDVAQAMQKSQPEGQQNPEMMKAMMKAQADAQALMVKTQADIEAKRLQTLSKIENMNATNESRHRIKEENAMEDLGIKAQNAHVDQQIKLTNAAIDRETKPEPKSA